MTGDRDDDDIFELTEDMASIPPPAPPGDGAVADLTTEARILRPPVPRSPFALLVRPKPKAGPLDSVSSPFRDDVPEVEPLSPEGTDPEGTDPEGTDPEGTDPEGTDPEGTDPEGARPTGKLPPALENLKKDSVAPHPSDNAEKILSSLRSTTSEDSPEESEDSPEESEDSPEESEDSSEESEGGPEESEGGPEESEGGPEESEDSSEESEGGPEESEDSPEESEGGPEESEDSSEESEDIKEGPDINPPAALNAESEDQTETKGTAESVDIDEPITDLHPIIEYEQAIDVETENPDAVRDDTTQVDAVSDESHDIPISVEEEDDGSPVDRPSGQDLGTPEEVFDTYEDEKEVSEEIDLDGAEDITVDVEDPELVVTEDTTLPEVAEELDLAEVEEITPPPPDHKAVAAPGHKRGRRPKMRRRNKRPKEWWADIFDDDYLALLPQVSNRDARREADFIEQSLSIAKGGLMLDLACGYGRHAVNMARRGYRVVGVDLSLPMLARAGDLAQEADQKINFIHGDMRDLGFDRTFDAVYCLGTSFGYFDEKTNFKVLEGVARALKPNGSFLLEVANRDHVITCQPNLTWFEGPGAVCMEETSFNYATSRLFVKRQLILSGGVRQLKHEVSLRLYSLHELGMMLHKAGFAISQVAGHTATPGAFFGADSAQIIILAMRR